MIQKQLPSISSEFTIRQALETVVDMAIIVESLQKVCYDGNAHEYREYNLVSRTQKQGTDIGDIEDMIIVYHQWKKSKDDESFKVFLEYEQFDYTKGNLLPTGLSKEVGLLLKIKK